MFCKFKKGTIVLVSGEGKEDPLKFYKKRYGKVVERDDFFRDFKIQFEDGTTDWIDAEYLTYSEQYNERRKSK